MMNQVNLTTALAELKLNHTTSIPTFVFVFTTFTQLTLIPQVMTPTPPSKTSNSSKGSKKTSSSSASTPAQSSVTPQGTPARSGATTNSSNPNDVKLSITPPSKDTTVKDIKEYIAKANAKAKSAGIASSDLFQAPVPSKDVKLDTAIVRIEQFAKSVTENLAATNKMFQKMSTKTDSENMVKRLQRSELLSKPLDNTKIKGPEDFNRFKELLQLRIKLYQPWKRFTVIPIKMELGRVEEYNLITQSHEIPERLIVEKSWIRGDSNRSSDETAVADLYKCLNNSISPKLRTHLDMYSTKVKLNGARYLYYLCKYLQDQNLKTIKDAEKAYQGFKSDLIQSNYDFDKVVPPLINHLTQLIQVNGPHTAVFGTIHNQLTTLGHSNFAIKITEKTLQYPKKTIQEAIDLLRHVVETIVPDLKMIEGDPLRFSAIDTSDKSDLAAMQAKIKKLTRDNKNWKNKMKKDKSSKRAHGNLSSAPPPTSSSSHSTNPKSFKTKDNFGSECFYETYEEFKEFQTGKLGRSAVTMNDKIWRWCDHCNIMTGHSTSHHKSNIAPTKRTRFNNYSKKVPPTAHIAEIDEPEANVADIVDLATSKPSGNSDSNSDDSDISGYASHSSNE